MYNFTYFITDSKYSARIILCILYHHKRISWRDAYEVRLQMNGYLSIQWGCLIKAS